MTEETKKQLMQSVYKLAEHYQIPNATLVTFKKRNLLLELLSTKDEDAFALINDVIVFKTILKSKQKNPNTGMRKLKQRKRL